MMMRKWTLAALLFVVSASAIAQEAPIIHDAEDYATTIAQLKLGQIITAGALLGGFAMSIATQMLTFEPLSRAKVIAFFIFLTSTMLFLAGLYTELRLQIEIAGVENLSDVAILKIDKIRTVGAGLSGVALLSFLAGTASLGWIKSKIMGVATLVISFLAFLLLNYVRGEINSLDLQPF